ncbi:hypothetical protein B0H16DRAFT_1838010 [Mycena metata]|uniref:Uncharacterized protein n=1 Tax=Mycena metata TaxID=1033252 RepID=A0AAD7K5M7_9AGAR|nr:hypothetical protein B0H16DRAFT_1838010 [Mycena metata]
MTQYVYRLLTLHERRRGSLNADAHVGRASDRAATQGDTGEHPFRLDGFKRVHPTVLILSHPAHARQSQYLFSRRLVVLFLALFLALPSAIPRATPRVILHITPHILALPSLPSLPLLLLPVPHFSPFLPLQPLTPTPSSQPSSSASPPSSLPLRSNTLFAVTFLATRILLHLVLLVSYARTPATRVPAGMLALVFPLHAMWFAGCVRRFVRRFRTRARGTSATSKGTSAGVSKRHPWRRISTRRAALRHPNDCTATVGWRNTTPAPPPCARASTGASSSPFYYPSATGNAADPPGWLPSSHYSSLAHRLAFLSRALRHSNNMWRPQRPILRAVRPRVMVRRMSASLVKALALASRPVVLDYVLGESGRKVHVHAHIPDPDLPIAGVEGERIAGEGGVEVELL